MHLPFPMVDAYVVSPHRFVSRVSRDTTGLDEWSWRRSSVGRDEIDAADDCVLARGSPPRGVHSHRSVSQSQWTAAASAGAAPAHVYRRRRDWLPAAAAAAAATGRPSPPPSAPNYCHIQSCSIKYALLSHLPGASTGRVHVDRRQFHQIDFRAPSRNPIVHAVLPACRRDSAAGGELTTLRWHGGL